MTDIFGTFTVDQTIFMHYNVTVNATGRRYTVGTQIKITGSRLGGETPTNDLTITVTGVGPMGEITAINWSGISYNGVQQFIVDELQNNTGSIDKVLYR